MTPAPLGNEHATINLIRQTIPEGFAIRTDPAGSIIVQKPGQKPGLMIFASLSEPTILITGFVERETPWHRGETGGS